MKIVVLIPAYNEEETITEVIQSIPKSFSGISKIDILVIDDGSRDRTAELAKLAGAIVFSHASNYGVGRAFKTGLSLALDLNADILVNIDADGQFSPEDIPLLIDPILKNKADLVVGDRFTDKNGKLTKPQYMSSLKFWGNKQMSNLISFLSDKKFSDVSCGFRAYSKEALLRLNLAGNFTYTQESFLDLANKGVEIKTIPIRVNYFPDRQSRVANNLFKYMYQTLKIIIRSYRDYKPMRFFASLGGGTFIFGLGCMIFTLIHFFQSGSFTPYKFVGFTGIFLFSLSIIFWIIGLFADMFVRTRLIQEQILYYEKRRLYTKE